MSAASGRKTNTALNEYPNGQSMSRLRSHVRSLREVFEGAVSVQYIASGLISFDAQRTAAKIGTWLAKRDFDQVGVRVDGVVAGYALRADLTHGRVGDHLRDFSDTCVVSGDLAMIEALEGVRAQVLYVRSIGEIGGIVTQADVSKPPVRLWLFGLLTVAEMQLTRLIRNCYPDNTWSSLLPPNRVHDAKKRLAAKKLKNSQVDLVDCLMLSDKRAILESSPQLSSLLLQPVNGRTMIDFQRIVTLRNAIAHADDIMGHWPSFLLDARQLERFIDQAEEISGRFLRS